MKAGPIGLFASCLFIALSAAAYADQDAESDKWTSRRIPYALTLSGGVSLGAYEAGINWAILRYLKDTSRVRAGAEETPVDNDLIAVTGASAGAINALISALAWCVRRDIDPATFPEIEPAIFRDTVGENVLRNMWTSIGLEKLLPGGGYRPDDGLLTRKAFADILGNLSALIGLEGDANAIGLPLPPGFSPAPRGKPVFRDGCKIHLGFTLTSERSRKLDVGGVSAPNQRYFVPLMLKVVDGRAKFYRAAIAPGLPGLGQLLVLPSKEGVEAADDVRQDSYEISNASVLNLVLASSAFPVAFGRRVVDHCVPARGSDADRARCPVGYIPARDVFVDGGIFDNIPLGGTRSLAENGKIEPGRRVTYLFINPDNLRSQDPDEQSGEREQRALRYGLAYQLQFLGGAVETARGHELYSELDSGDWTRQLTTLTRDFPELADQRLSSPFPTGLGDKCKATFEALEARPPRTGTMALQPLADCLQYSADEYEHAVQYGPNTNLAELRSRAFRRLEGGADQLLKGATAPSASYKTRVARFKTRLRRALDDEGGDRRVMLSSRFFPLTGEYLGAFGAFFDRPFREYDYYAGLYDAVHGIAGYICDIQTDDHDRGFREGPADDDCRGKEARNLYRSFGIGEDSKGSYVFARLASMEHPEGTEGWGWISQPERGVPEESQLRSLKIVLDSICDFETSQDPTSKETTYRVVPVKDFDQFLRRLRDRRYYSADTSAQLGRTLRDDRIDKWWTGPAALVSRRLEQLEKETRDAEEACKKEGKDKDACEEKKPHLDVASKRAANAAAWYDTDSRSPIDFVGTNGSIAPWLPHEFGTSIGEKQDLRSLYLSWEWRTRLAFNELPVFAHVAPVQYFYEPDPVALTRIGGRWHWFPSPELTLGFGFDFNHRWKANPTDGRRSAFGASGFVEWRHIRATLGLRDLIWNASDKFAQDHAEGAAIAHALPYLDIAFVF